MADVEPEVRPTRTGELLSLYLVSRVGIFGLVAFSFLWPRYGSPRIPLTNHPIQLAVPMPGFLVPFMNWDAGQYVKIAADGYQPSFVPYFPLYPLLIRALSLGQRAWMAPVALLISLLATALAVVVLARLIAIDRPRAVWPAIALLLVFPGAIFFALPYTEATTLLFFVLAAYAARRRAWWLAGVAGALAAATRPPGLAIIVLLVIEYALTERPWRLRDLPALLLPAAGPALYLAYVWRAFGDPRLFLHGEQAYGRALGGVPVQFTTESTHLWTSLNFWVMVLALALALWSIRLLRPSYGAFAAVLALAGLITGELESTVRFIAIAWPLFMAAGVYLTDERRLFVVGTAFALGIGFFAILFTHGYWVS